MDAYWRCGRPTINNINGWPDIESYVNERLRAVTEQIAEAIVDQLYDNDDFEKDMRLK